MYSEKFKAAVKNDILKRLDEDENFASQFGELCQNLDENSIRNIAYEKYAKKPEFQKYLNNSSKGFLDYLTDFTPANATGGASVYNAGKTGLEYSQSGQARTDIPDFIEDIKKVPEAWNSGDFLGHFQAMARNGIDGNYDAQEQAYQNYKKWAELNPNPEGKTFLGKVIQGVANQANLMADMQPDALAQAGATGLALGGVASLTNAVATPIIGAPTTAGAAMLGTGIGYKTSMLKQAYEIGYADVYTALRDEGIDNATANTYAGLLAVPYAGLEYAKLKYIPGLNKVVGGNSISEIVSNIADKKLKGKVARALAKRGVDFGTGVAVGTGTEALQGGIIKIGEDLAQGKGIDVGKVASGMYDEAKAVFPTMVGTAGLGTIADIATAKKTHEAERKIIQQAIEEGRKPQDVYAPQTQPNTDEKPAPEENAITVPKGTKEGEIFVVNNKAYQNVKGKAVEYVAELTPDVDNLEADAEADPYGPTIIPEQVYKPIVQMGEDGRAYAQTDNETKQISGLDFSEENAAKYYQPYENNQLIQNMIFDREKRAKAEEEARRLEQLEEEELRQAEALERAKKYEQKQRKLYNKQNRINAISKKIAKIDNVEYRLDAMDYEYENGNIDKLTDDQLMEASEYGYEWADKELSRRALEDNLGTTLLDFLQEYGFKLPTPAAIKREADKHHLSLNQYLYGEIEHIYNSLPKDKQLRYFSKNYTSIDDMLGEFAQYGFYYDSDTEFISDVGENLFGRKITTGHKFSLADTDYSKMSDKELIEAHAKAEQSQDQRTGRAITDEWLKRKGYKTDVYHGSPKSDITEFKDESYFTKNEDYAKRYKRGENGKIYETKLNLKKPFDTRNPKERAIFEKEFYRKWGNGAPLSERGLPDWTDGSDLLEFLDENGYDYDGIILDEGADGGYGETVKQRGESYVPRSASQIKSRDAFTYGDDGKYIPLDKRGDINNPDIRYAVSEENADSKAKVEEIKREVSNLKSKFDKKAKHKSNVDIVGTVNEARENLGGNIPDNARGIQSGNRIILVAENLDDAETGARVFLHEQVGHFGLRGLLGKDLRPFLNYVIKHYKGTKAWNDIASKPDYAKQGDYAIAEEILAHLAENRELSDPSMWKRIPRMWKRIVHKVKRALFEKGVPQEYVNLLDEDVLRSAIVLSREWAKGDHYLNANGVWESVKNNRSRTKDIPEDENFSLNDSETQRQYDEVVAKYKDTPLWMKAPNGQPTKLTERQWVMVRTQNFKKWFGDWENDPANASKVVDENGEPLVVYHGSGWNPLEEAKGDAVFDSNFIGTSSGDIGWFGKGHYFAYTKYEASTYGGNVGGYFLNIRNPFMFQENLESLFGTETSDFEAGPVAPIVNLSKLFPNIGKQTFKYGTDSNGDFKTITFAQFAKEIEDIEKSVKFKAYPIGDGIFGQEWGTRAKESKRVVDLGNRAINKKYAEDKIFNVFKYWKLKNNIRYLRLPRLTTIIQESSFTEDLKAMGYDGVLQSKYGDEAVAFNSNQIKSATDNVGTYDPSNPDIRFSLAENSNNLVVLHNITTDKLKYANRMGGLPIPSLAVSRVEYPVEDFGDILLIAPKDILNERSAKTFNADVYSPRQPKATIEVSRKEEKRIEKEVLKRAKANGIDENYAYLDFSEEDIETAFVKNRIIQQLYEKETGNDFGGYWDLRDSKWFKDFIKDLNIQFTEKLYKGRRYDGSPLYAPYTLENIARLMKKNGIRGGENLTYGVGTIRAYTAKELKNVKAVQSQRNKIISADDMIAVKEQTEETFSKLLSNAVENLKSGGKYFGATDEVYESIIEAIKTRNWSSVMKRDFKDNFNYMPLKNFVESLADLPTEYFETKLQRVMRLNEFVGAVIPSYADEDIRNILDENGIPYKEYKGKDMSTTLDEFTSEIDNQEKIRFSLIGEKGIANYGSEYQDRLETAKKLDAQGVHPAEIWQKTGWAKNKLDGKWRYEITDGDVKSNIQGNRIYQLEDVYDAKALYNAYPELRETFIQFKPLENGGGALVNNDYIVVDNHFANNPRALRRILIHEIQHWIQNVEGWHTGSAEQYFQDDKSERVQRLDEVLERKEYIVSEIKRIEASGDYKEVSKKMIQDLIDGKISDAEFDTRYEQLLSNTQAEYGQRSLKDLVEEKAALIAEEMELTDAIANESNLTAYDKYMRTAGEVEARNAEKRQTELTAEQRRKIPPEATQDFPYEEQIVFEGKNKQADFPINVGNYFRQIKDELPIDETAEPVLLDNAGSDIERFKRASEVFNAMPMFTHASDGVKIKLKVSEGGSIDRRVVHIISDNATGNIAPQKLAWLPNIRSTIENAQIRLKGKYDPRKQKKDTEPNRIYIRRYNNGTIHAVVVSPFGEIIGQDIKSANVITQYPVEKIGEVYDATVEWINPNMTKASNAKSEASHIKDLSHKGTVPSPKTNSPTSNSSTISDSRHLSMSESSENSPESQAHFSLGEEELSEKEKAKLYKQKRARELITSVAGRATQATLDAFHSLNQLERVVRGKIQDAAKSAWKMALMTRNLDQVMFHLFEIGNIEYDKATGTFKKREGTIGLKKILEPVKKNYQNFRHYALAKCALQRWAILRKQNFYTEKTFQETFGFTEEDARQWVKDGDETTQKAFKRLQAFFQAQRKFMLETGLISEDRYKTLSRFTNYVPFFRMGEDLDAETQEVFDRANELNPGGRGFSGRDSGIKPFEGSARQTKDLIENIINQARSVMDAGYKNIAMYRSLNLMREIGLATYIKQNSEEAKATLGEMKKRLEEQGFDVSEMSDEDIMRKNPIEVFYDVSSTDEKEQSDIVSVRVNGGLRFYKVEDKELLVAIKNFGGEKFSVGWKLLTVPKNIMTAAITKLPEFAIRNFIRDTGSNTILFGGKNVPGYLTKTIGNIGKVAYKDGYMQKLWASGAGGGSWYSVRAEDFAKDYKGGTWNKAKKIGKYTVKPFSWLFNQYERRVLIPSEQANRASVMEKTLKNGASDMEAAFQAMDVLNFGMRGSGVWTGENEYAKATAKVFQAIVRITPFLNARLQGLYKIWRESGASEGTYKQGEEFGLKNRSKAFIQSVSKGVLMRAGMLAGTAILYSIYANGSEDEDGEKWYEKIPSEDKLNYWHFYLGGNTIVRIPKPFEIGLMFATVPETMVNSLLQERPDAQKVLWKGLVNTMEFNPTANPVFDTIREQISNKDSFTGRPIVQQSDQDLAPKYQYDENTSATAKAIASVFDSVGLDKSWLASPARVQNAIGNMLAGMTRYITAASDPIIESITDIEGGTSRYARESVLSQPFKWATRNTKTMNTRNNTDFYELRAHCRELYASARLLRQEGRLEELQDIIDNHKGELGNYSLVEAVNSRLNEISRQRKALGRNKTLSNDEIIAEDDKLLMERNRLLADVDILIDRIDKKQFIDRDFREILKRIQNAGKDKKTSKTVRRRLRELSQMR